MAKKDEMRDAMAEQGAVPVEEEIMEEEIPAEPPPEELVEEMPSEEMVGGVLTVTSDELPGLSTAKIGDQITLEVVEIDEANGIYSLQEAKV